MVALLRHKPRMGDGVGAQLLPVLEVLPSGSDRLR